MRFINVTTFIFLSVIIIALSPGMTCATIKVVTIPQTLSAYGQTGIATWVIGESNVSEPLPVKDVVLYAFKGDRSIPEGVTYILSCSLSLKLADNSIRTLSFNLNNVNDKTYLFPEILNVTQIAGGNCSAQFTNTNDYDVTFQSDRDNGYATAGALSWAYANVTQSFAMLDLKGTLTTVPGCTVEVDNPSIAVSGTGNDFKQGFTAERNLNIECSTGVPQPNIALTSAGVVNNNCVLMPDADGSTVGNGPKVCVYNGDEMLPVDFSVKHNITLDKDTDTGKEKLIFKISTADDSIKLLPGEYTAIVYIVVSPL